MQIGEYVLFDRLLDTYGSLLTERQLAAAVLHVREDLSLSEIAVEMGITKQAVSDALATARAKLDDYEKKLGLLALQDAYEGLMTLITQKENDEDIIRQAKAVEALLKTK